jgi:hypothetical protein
MIMIARQSIQIMKPFNKSSMDVLKQFKKLKYAEKLKIQITSESLPPTDEGLLAFLYNQVITLAI